MYLGKLLYLRAKGFQSHTDTTLHFAPTMTAIRGENNTGKTAMFRAGQALFYLDPCMERTGVDQMIVEAGFEEGVVRRIRNVSWKENKDKGTLEAVLLPKGQSYELEINGKVKKFPVPKTGMEEELVEFINMAFVVFDDKKTFSLNMSEQTPSRGPFLIGDGYSGAIRTKVLGSANEAYLFDEMAKDSKTKHSSLKKEHKVIKALLHENLDRVKKIKEEPNHRAAYKAVKEKLNDFRKLKRSVREKEEVLETISSRVETIRTIRERLDSLPTSEDLTEGAVQVRTLRGRIQDRSSLLQRLRGSHQRVGALHASLGGMPSVHRLGELVREIQDCAKRAASDLPDRIRTLSDRVVSLRGVRSEPGEGELRGRLREIEDLTLRCSDRTRLHDRLLQSAEAVRSARAECAHHEAVVDERRQFLLKSLSETRLCPYAPFDVELQSKCMEKMKV